MPPLNNQILSKKYPTPFKPHVQLWRHSSDSSCAIPLGISNFNVRPTQTGSTPCLQSLFVAILADVLLKKRT